MARISEGLKIRQLMPRTTLFKQAEVFCKPTQTNQLLTWLIVSCV